VKAIDTNVVVRFLLGEDEAQTRQVHRIFIDAEQQGSTLFIVTAVLLETIWVLDSVYHCSRQEIINAIENLTKMPILHLEHRDTIVTFCRKSRDIDLADQLIGLISKDAGCDTTLTFDRKAAKTDLFTLIA
jgi:predicted nucleic-acid-binding protein